MGGRHNIARKAREALKNAAKRRKTPSGKLNIFLAQERTGLRPTPYSSFSRPGQKVTISPARTRTTWSAPTVDTALKLSRKLAKGPDGKHKRIPYPGKVGKGTLPYKK